MVLSEEVIYGKITRAVVENFNFLNIRYKGKGKVRMQEYDCRMVGAWKINVDMFNMS